MYLPPEFTICCDIDNYVEHNHVISPDDHVAALDANNDIHYPHIPGHENHYRSDVWNLWRADFNYVDGCSECD